jgi:hypothetical protein
LSFFVDIMKWIKSGRIKEVRPGVTPRGLVTNHSRSTPLEARLLAIAFRD